MVHFICFIVFNVAIVFIVVSATGGHLHNIGVVLVRKQFHHRSSYASSPSLSLTAITSLQDTIIRMCLEFATRTDVGMLNYTQVCTLFRLSGKAMLFIFVIQYFQNSSIHTRHHDVGLLIGLVSWMFIHCLRLMCYN